MLVSLCTHRPIAPNRLNRLCAGFTIRWTGPHPKLAFFVRFFFRQKDEIVMINVHSILVLMAYYNLIIIL